MQNNKEKKIKFTVLQNEITHVLTSYWGCNTGQGKMYLEEETKWIEVNVKPKSFQLYFSGGKSSLREQQNEYCHSTTKD